MLKKGKVPGIYTHFKSIKRTKIDKYIKKYKIDNDFLIKNHGNIKLLFNISFGEKQKIKFKVQGSLYSLNIKGWLTPAVKEDLANQIMMIPENENIDIINFIKLGFEKYENKKN